MTIAVQIDTTLYRSKIGVSHGFQRFDHPFNRTVVTTNVIPEKSPFAKEWKNWRVQQMSLHAKTKIQHGAVAQKLVEKYVASV